MSFRRFWREALLSRMELLRGAKINMSINTFLYFRMDVPESVNLKTINLEIILILAKYKFTNSQ